MAFRHSKGRVGRPCCRPDSLLGDRAYDAEYIRYALRARQILPRLAMRNTKHGSGLGRWRWVFLSAVSLGSGDLFSFRGNGHG